MKIQLPEKVDIIISKLMEHGYEAYAVGGCVRDSILGKNPTDWDITTSAPPYEVKQIFRRTIDTGIQHGTVTVMMEKEAFEVTTYRIDGEYEDNRRPKEVEFTSDLIEDLKRRDFTINAMAYNKIHGLVDVFGGLSDLNLGMIRCVGSAKERFDEDALRILRAIRFSAQLGFTIEAKTLEAVREKSDHLQNISAERIRIELCKLLTSQHPAKLLDAYDNGITRIILPEFDKLMHTNQNNIHHIYNVGYHTIKSIEEVGKDKNKFSSREILILRLTMLLHDIEKPSCATKGDDGKYHFYGHQEKGATTAKDILRRLKFDNETIDLVYRLVKWHDYEFELTPYGMRKSLHLIGIDIMDLLLEVKKADMLAQNPITWFEKTKKLNKAKELIDEIKDKEECVSLKDLKVNGRDLMDIGLKSGKIVGHVLDLLLEEVLKEPTLNNKEALIKHSQSLLISIGDRKNLL